VGRDGHDGAGAIGHQYVIGDPDGDLDTIDRVDGIRAGEYASLFLIDRFALDIRLACSLFLVSFDGFCLTGRG